MNLPKRIHNSQLVIFLKKLLRKKPSVYLNPKQAYNLIANSYSEKEFNLFNYFDQIFLKNYLNKLELKNKIVLDYGCGTGWKIPILKQHQFKEIFVSDLSEEMLKICLNNHQNIKPIYLTEDSFLECPSNSIDIITCNLVIGYVKNLNKLFIEWNRVIKPNGFIVITDVHPNLNKSGKNRNFIVDNKNIIVESFPYHIADLKDCSKSTSLFLIEGKDHLMDSSHKKNLPKSVYDNFNGKEIIYSAVFEKN